MSEDIDSNEERSCGEKSCQQKSCFEFFKPLIGFSLLFMSAFFFCITNVLVKLAKNFDVFNLSFYRFVIFFLLSLPFVIFREKLFFPKGYRIKLIIRALFGTGGILSQFFGLKYMSIADVNMITSVAPFVTVFLASCILNEKITKIDIINFFITFIGVILIIKPPIIFGSTKEYEEDPDYIYGVISTVSSVFIVGGALVSIRMVKDLPAATVIMTFGFFGGIISLVMIFTFTQFIVPQTIEEIIYISFIGITSALAQMGLTIALKFENAAIGGLIRMSLLVIFSFAIQILFFSNIPGLYSILGAILISFVILSSGMKKIFDSLPEENQFKLKINSLFNFKSKQNTPSVAV